MKYLFLVCLFFCSSVSAQPIAEESLLNQGLELEKQGHYKEALEVWASAITELDSPSLAISREYIRLATGQGLRDDYETASSIYMWGLSADEIEPNRTALREELAMLRPLTNQDNAREWERLLETGNPIVYEKIHRFWQQLDPTPSSRYNERLLEHWERIAYARRHYERWNDPPYGTDDRGPAYVKYGEPDRIKDGQLTISRGEVYTDCGILPGCNPALMPDVVMDLDQNPFYEIWIYERPNREMEYNLILMFGERPSEGFRRVNIVEDFIPRRAFSFNDNRYGFQSLTGVKTTPGDLVTPGMMMQWIYYKQLAATDFFFGNRFSEMESEWVRFDSEALGKYQGPMHEEQAKSITLRERKKAPESISTYEKEFPAIPVRDFQYRFLDEQNRPLSVIFLESQPRQVFLEDLAVNEEILFPGDTTTAEDGFSWYELTHGLYISDEDGEILSQTRQESELILDFEEDQPSSSVFTVPYVDGGHKLLLFAELHNRHPDSRPRMETPFPPELRGLGKLESELPEPLSTDPDKLEMGDLILGWQMRDDARGDALFPFVVANSREIPENEELAVHLEIYNLRMADDGFTDFQIDYAILPVRRMEWLRGREEEFSLTISQETTTSRFVENLEIETRELPPGSYRLQMKTTDNISGQQVEREIEFRVTEKVNKEELGLD